VGLHLGCCHEKGAIVKGDDFLLVNEVATVLRVAPNTVRAWGAAGKLTEYRHPVNNYRLFKKKDVDALLAEIENPSARPAPQPKPKPR
jgi:DNA (cytosine-5)-methyltransferase 1